MLKAQKILKRTVGVRISTEQIAALLGGKESKASHLSWGISTKIREAIDYYLAKNKKSCEWGKSSLESNHRETECGFTFWYKERYSVVYFKFCPFCGRPIKEVR